MKKNIKTDKMETVNFAVLSFVRLILVLAVGWGFFEQNWMAVFVSVLTLVLTWLPSFFEKKYKINLPAELQIGIVLFIYASLFLGEVRGYYARLWWWDSFLHLFSGVALGLVGFLILYVLYKNGKLKAGAGMVAVLAFCLAVTAGTLWEIFEFLMDSFLGLDMQRARNLELVHGVFDTRLGVFDTMIDLMLNSLGSLVASVAGYFYLKNGEFFILDRLVKRFEKENPRLFRKKSVKS